MVLACGHPARWAEGDLFRILEHHRVGLLLDARQGAASAAGTHLHRSCVARGVNYEWRPALGSGKCCGGADAGAKAIILRRLVEKEHASWSPCILFSGTSWRRCPGRRRLAGELRRLGLELRHIAWASGDLQKISEAGAKAPEAEPDSCDDPGDEPAGLEEQAKPHRAAEASQPPQRSWEAEARQERKRRRHGAMECERVAAKAAPLEPPSRRFQTHAPVVARRRAWLARWKRAAAEAATKGTTKVYSSGDEGGTLSDHSVASGAAGAIAVSSDDDCVGSTGAQPQAPDTSAATLTWARPDSRLRTEPGGRRSVQ